MLTKNEEDINTDFMFVSLYRFICPLMSRHMKGIHIQSPELFTEREANVKNMEDIL
jgi:hypothetical protein